MSDIPNDIILQILPRVPAKSLIRLRWACKYWFDLITRDHDFIKMHFHHSTQSMISTVSGHSFLISSYKKDDDTEKLSKSYKDVLISRKEDGKTEKLYKCYLNYNTGDGEEEQEASSSSQVRITFPFQPRSFKVLGSCNGLILLLTTSRLQDRTIVWNPCTNEYQVIPDSPIIENSTTLTCGLGYDSIIDDYKVVRIINSYERKGLDIQVYTLGTNSWKSNLHVSYDNYYPPSLSNGVFANGGLYWLDLEHGCATLFSFDFVKEKFQWVPVFRGPGPYYSEGLMKLQVFEGSLYYTIVYSDVVEIWIMSKDYHGVNNDEYLGTKLYTYAHDQPCCHAHGQRCTPNWYRMLRFTKRGEILMVNNDKHLCLCGPNNNKVKIIKTICDPHSSVKEVYIESLVSLKSGTYVYESRTEK